MRCRTALIEKATPPPLAGGEGAVSAAEGRGGTEQSASEREVPGVTAEIAFGGFEPLSGKTLTRRYAPPSPSRGEGFSWVT